MMRPVTTEVITTFGLSERHACAITGMNRTSYRYESKEPTDDGLWDRIKHLADKHVKYGYRMITLKLRQEKVLANHKRIERIYREEGLQLARRRKNKKTGSAIRNEPEAVTFINEEWAMDFVSDTLYDNSRLRVFNLIDTFSRMSMQQQARTSISGVQVTQYLDQTVIE